MKPTLFACAVVFAAASLAAPAIAQPPGLHATVQLAAAKKHKVVKHDRRASRQIACTKLGCIPIPPQCHPQGGMLDFRGNPTGYDGIVCP
jgi:hypothetical protein